jgi:hypothetical protein
MTLLTLRSLPYGMIDLHKLLQSGDDMSGYNRQPVVPVIMVAAGVVLILGAVFWSMNIGQSPPRSGDPGGIGAPLNPPAASANTPDVPASGLQANPGESTQEALRIPYPEVARISASEAKAAFDSGQAVFIDTRGEPYFSTGHIPGSIPMTSTEAPSRLGELNPNDWIITYCT